MMAANPLPSYWDEAGYYASTVHFTRLVRHFGLSRFGTAWNFDPFRPPINVILPLPIALVAPNSLLAMRLVSWICFIAAALLVALTVKRVVSRSSWGRTPSSAQPRDSAARAAPADEDVRRYESLA